VTQVVRCFGFGMSLRRMANLKAMEFCVKKKKILYFVGSKTFGRMVYLWDSPHL